MSLIASNLCLKPDTEYHLNDVCFEMSKGEIYTIIGRTLAGKTTLLKTIAGLIAPESGSLTLDGSRFWPHPGLEARSGNGVSTIHQLSTSERL